MSQFERHAGQGPRDEIQTIIDAAASRHLTESTRLFLERGLTRLEDREFCDDCPAALLCASAQTELNDLAPTTTFTEKPKRRQDALSTLAHVGIRASEVNSLGDLCFFDVIHSVDNGILLPAAETPNGADPLDPGSLLWLSDRIREYMRHAAGIINSGQRI